LLHNLLKYAPDFDDYAPILANVDPKKQYNKAVSKKYAKIGWLQSGDTFYRHGNTVIFSPNVPGRQRQVVLGTIDWLVTMYPHDTGRVVMADVAAPHERRVQTLRLSQSSDNPVLLTAAATTANIIRLESAFDETVEEANINVDRGWNVPASRNLSPIFQTLVHEWGHTKDSAATKPYNMWEEITGDRDYPALYGDQTWGILGAAGLGSLLKHGPADIGMPSAYAIQGFPVESYAEVFTEWHLSEGKTPNIPTQLMAETEGWYKFDA
jgi:hypothetical protein